MRWLRWLSSLALACLALSCGFVALSPCEAYADDIDYTTTHRPYVIYNSSDDWSNATFYSSYYWNVRSLAFQSETGTTTETATSSGTAQSNLTYIVPNIAGEIRTTSLGGKWLWYSSEYLNGQYSHAINGSMALTGTTQTTGNMQVTGYCSNTEPLMFGDMNAKVVTSGYIYMGISYYGGYTDSSSIYRPLIARKGQRFKLMYTPETLGTADDVNGKNFTYTTNRITYYHLYYKETGVSPAVEITADSNGIYTIPKDCVYLAVCFRVNNNSNYKRFLVIDAPNLILLDDNIKQITENQTEELMSTDGSDDIASDAMVGGKVNEIKEMDIFNFIGTIDQTVGNAVQTQDVDGSVVFPGMSMAGFTIPSYTIYPMGEVDSNIRDVIKLMVTFVFCSAFITHIIRLCQCIFGIYEYGVGFEDFGDGEYSRVPVNRSFKADYSIDEDLGF